MLDINKKGKKLKKAACVNGAGRLLVDRIKPESASMHSTISLEPSSFINPELTWKKVKKVCRSTNRRSRNSLCPNLNVGPESGNKSCKRDRDSSESEKHGVAVLGRHFADKIVDVPIKKRRFSNRPPSPPPRTPLPDQEGSLSPQQQTPPHTIESEQLVDIKPSGAGRHRSQGLNHNSKIWVSDKSVVPKFEDKVDEVSNGKKYEMLKAGYASDDDFSGIELLAAAACSSSIDNDVKLEESCALKVFAKAEAVDSPSVTIPFKESIASSVTSHFSGTELVNEDDMGESAAVSKNVNGGVVRNRFHWDLNTVMEAWEEPDDVTPVDCQINCSEIVPGDTHCKKINMGNSAVQSNVEDVLRDTERVVQSVVCKEVPSDVGCIKELADGIVVTVGRSCIEEDTLKTCSSSKGTYIEKQYVTTSAERVKEALNVAVYDTIADLPVTSIEACGNYLFPGLQHTASLQVFEEKMHASNCELEQLGEVSCGISVEENRKLLSEGPQVGKLEIVTRNLPLLNNIGHEINDSQIKDCIFYENTTGSSDSKTSAGQVISTVTHKTSDVGNFMGELDRANHFYPSPKSEALSASSTSVVVGEVKPLANKASAADTNVIDITLKNRPLGLLNKSDCIRKFDQNISDSYYAYATEDVKKADIEQKSEYEAGYDSSFEDGELREPGLYNWEGNDLEEETEYVDYGSEYGDGYDFDSINSKSANAESGQDVYQSSRQEGTSLGNNDIGKVGAGDYRSAAAGDSKPPEHCFNGGIMDESHLACTKGKVSGGNQLNKHLKYEVAQGKVDAYGDDKRLLAGEFGSRAFRGNLSSSSAAGPSPLDAVEKKTSLGVPRNRFDNSNYSYPRAERGFGLEKSTGRGRFSFQPFVSRNETDGQWVDCQTSYRDTRDTRNRYPQNYRGPEGRAYSRPRNSTAAFATKFGGCNYEDDSRPIVYSSNNGLYRSSMEKKSPANRESSYVGQRGIPPVRGIGQNRSRGRSGHYVHGIRRGSKAEYSVDIPDDAAPRPIRRQPYFCRRERGFSPNYGGGHFMRRNSCSRSPTRSSVAWNSQRDRNMNTRRRSPDLRSDGRMERSSPFQKNSFGADNEEIYTSPPKNGVSPHKNSRWFNDRNYTDNQVRERRSPVRMFRGRQRMDFVGYSGNKSDRIFRPNIHCGSFQQSSSTRREPELEVSVDEKRNHDRYEINHRVRRSDTGGAVRRFRYDADDCLEARNARNDDNVGRAIKRDIARNGAGEESGPRYNSGNRMYASGSSAGQRDFNEEAASREE